MDGSCTPISGLDTEEQRYIQNILNKRRDNIIIWGLSLYYKSLSEYSNDLLFCKEPE